MANKGSPFSFPPDLQTIFVDTNIDTHLAMVVSLNDTISDVKAKIMAEHSLCFQDIGEISIQAVKVKRRGLFYTLADSMCVWNAFHGFKGSWFVCIDAVPMCSVKNPEIVADKVTHEHMPHHFNGVTISPCEPEKRLAPDGQGSHNAIVMSRDHDGRPEMLIDQNKDDGRKDDCMNLGDETSNGMDVNCAGKTISDKTSKTSQLDDSVGSQSQHYLVEKKRGKKVRDGLHADYLEDCRGSKFCSSENVDDHYKDDRRGSKTGILTACAEGLLGKLPYESTIHFQNHPVEQSKKRKRKSSKSHEEAHLALPSETIVPRSSQVTLDPQDSGKHVDASIYIEKYPVGPNNNLVLPNDGRHIGMTPNTASSFKVTNQEEKDGHSMETCMVVISSANREPIEDQILQANLEGKREKHVNLAQETNGDVRHKESEETRISSHAHCELPFKFYCSTDKLTSPSSKVLESKALNNQQSREVDTAKCMTELNPREDEAGPVDKMKGIPSLAEKFSYEDQGTYGVSKNFPGDEYQCLDKETDAAANLKEAGKDKSLIQVNSKDLRKSRRSKKRLKTESSRSCGSTEINGDQENINPDCAQVSLNDVHHEYNAANITKHADQKTNRGQTMIKSSSSKDIPNQEQVSHLNSGNAPINMPHSLSEVSNLLVEKASENRVTSQPDFEVQSTPGYSKKMLNSELSELRSPGASDVVLVKSNEEVIGCNEVGGFDPSKLANGSNQKLVQHGIDARFAVSLSDEDSSRLAKMSQVNQNQLDLSSCKQDLCEQSNVKVLIKEGDLTHILSHGALAGPTKCKCNRKKSKKEVLKALVSSEMSEHMERCGHGDAGINFSDFFVSKKSNHTLNVLTADSPTDLVHSASHKHHVVESLPQKGDPSHYSAVDAAHDTTLRDSKPRNADKAESTSQSGKQNSLSRIESNSSLHEANEYQKLDNKLQDYGTNTHFQLPKSDGLESKQGKVTEDGKEIPSLPFDRGIGNMVSNDEYVRCKNFNSSTSSNPVGNAVDSISFYVSPSEGTSSQVASSDSIEDTPYHLRRFRVVRKIPIRRSKSRTQNS